MLKLITANEGRGNIPVCLRPVPTQGYVLNTCTLKADGTTVERLLELGTMGSLTFRSAVKCVACHQVILERCNVTL